MEQHKHVRECDPAIEKQLKIIVVWRVATAISWAVVFQYCIVVMCQVLLAHNGGSWWPNVRLQNILVGLSPVSILLLLNVVCVHGFILSKHYIRYPTMPQSYSRVAVIANVCTVKFFTLLCTHIFTSSSYFFVYYHLGVRLNLIDSEVSTCKNIEWMYLGESQLYLMLCGVWIGIFCFAKCRVIGLKLGGPCGIDFPYVHQKKYCYIMAGLKSVLKKAAFDAILPTTCFVIIYFLLGNSVKQQLCEFLNLKVNSVSQFSLSNIGLLLYSWLVYTLYLFDFYIVDYLLRSFLMQPIEFPITLSYGSPNNFLLRDALKIKNMRIIQHLGYRDLMFVAGTDIVRRSQVFSLSQPGGHPYHWNALVNECIELIVTFTNDLGTANEYYQQLLANIYPKESNASLPSRQTNTERVPKPFMRNLSLSHNFEAPNISADSESSAQQIENVRIALSEQFDKLKQKLFRNPIAKYMFDDRAEIRFRHIISLKGQLVIWATQSLAMFASASFDEDTYGVVQMDLPLIINVLLELKKALDKIQKLGSYKKLDENDKFDIKSKNALKTAVKRSLYKITLTFGSYIKELPLSRDTHQQLQSYVAFKEG